MGPDVGSNVIALQCHPCVLRLTREILLSTVYVCVCSDFADGTDHAGINVLFALSDINDRVHASRPLATELFQSLPTWKALLYRM